MKIAIAVPNYNGGEMLLKTLESLYAHTSQHFDLYLVDDKSSDDSAKRAQEKYPQAHVIFSQVNQGYGASLNLAIKEILKHDYDLTAVVTTDLIFTDGWLNHLIKCIEASPKVAAVNPLIIYQDQFRLLQIKSDRDDLFLSHDDYRFFINWGGNPNSDTNEITMFNRQFIQPKAHEFTALVDSKLESFPLYIYDERLTGYKLEVGDQVISESKLKALAKKILFKLKLLPVTAKLKEVMISVSKSEKPVRIANALGAGFRDGRELPENYYIGQTLDKLPQDKQKVELFFGAAVLLNNKALKKVGMFDPKYFMYYEESDLGMRMRQAGWEIYSEPKSVIYHLERGSKSEKTLDFMRASQKLFMDKWGPVPADKLK
jgi:GT2 family glycosyltransferase